jgi:hypothetical protein
MARQKITKSIRCIGPCIDFSFYNVILAIIITGMSGLWGYDDFEALERSSPVRRTVSTLSPSPECRRK